MAVTAAEVKALREKTGAGMMDCKKALEECNGNMDDATKLLKERGLAAMAKRADRATEEGRVFIKIDGKRAAIAELVCETDFVAKNDDFIKCGEEIVAEAHANGINEVTDALSAKVLEVSTKTRENMKLKRVETIDIPADCVASSYVHSNFKIGSIVLIKVEPASAKSADLEKFAHECCLHYAAYTPSYVAKSDVPKAYVDEQTEIFTKQTEEQMPDKPEKVRAGIVQGKLNKHLAEICFMNQMFIDDEKKSVEQVFAEESKKIGGKISLQKVVCYVLGA